MENLKKQLGLFLVKKREKEAAMFKEIEESKWGKKKKEWIQRDDVEHNEAISNKYTEFRERGGEEEQSEEVTDEKAKKMLAIMERVKTMQASEWLSMIEEDFVLFENEEETHTRPGVVGLSAYYHVEDFDAVKYK